MVEYNPFSRETVHNPFPTYQRLRDEAPVYHNAEVGFWALSRYQDVIAAHLDTDVFSSAHGVTIEGVDQGAPFLIVKDPPEHTLHRKIVARMFTPRRIAQLEPFIRRTAAELLDRVRDADRFDLVQDFSFRLPLDVISELIGIPVAQREPIHELSDRIAARTEDGGTPQDVYEASAELWGILAELVRDRRRNPGDDVITLLMNTQVEDEDGTPRSLGDGELASRFLELAFAGHETVAKLIPNGVIALTWYPDQRRELVADPSLIPNAIEEMLRWDPPSHYQGRWTLREVELHGVTIPADQRVILITGSAVHDERKYPDPELFDIHRDIDRHVSFGFGRHLCLGASLARLETRVAFEELLKRFPDFGIDETGVQRQYSGNVRGLSSLPLLIERSAAV
ncbi:Cytochrome P450 [Thermomonospora echinospora]|uniref:Cytochrome P450 n=1 Tax=Thermomonospora echinospora TaxID=1992 RepID=A0A1H5T2Q5_9ACTN|nr:cytochrome P450 [Thermomonospora echinospora]SEF57070.1 Cytochrome P450 [Thermomonospora echinospora]